MNVWAVRGGADGEYEDYALREGVTLVDFGLRRDATDFENRDALRDYLAAESPRYEGSLRRAANAASQLWKFANEIKPGDMILLPRKKAKTIAVGRIAGGYRLDDGMPFDACHARPVEWSASGVSRDDLDDDIIKVIRSMLTVFQVRPEGAAERIDDVVAALYSQPPAAAEESAVESHSRTLSRPPSPSPDESEEEAPNAALPDAPAPDESSEEEAPNAASAQPDESPTTEAPESAEREPSIDSLIADRVIRRVRSAFPGADLACLVSSILGGYGYTVASVSPSDEESRVHILAGRGDMGFDGPGLLAHLHLGDEPASAEDCHRLRESARAVGAQRSLLVSMAGFSDSARRENARSFFTARLWDARDVVSSLIENYERLPAPVRAAVPMQTRWTLVES